MRSPRTSVTRRCMALLTAALSASLFFVPGTAAAHSAVECWEEKATIVGTSGPDELIGTPGRDVIVGLAGKDVIRGLGGDDLICGGPGGDLIMGGKGNDFIRGGTGHDILKGGPGNDTIRGGRHNDRAFGNRGTADTVLGRSGSDVCIAESEANCELNRRKGHDPERWRDLVDAYFGPLADEAMRVLDCESRGEPFAVNAASGASGLFQFLPSTWERWNPRTPGWEGETPFHPEANIATAKRLVDASVDEGHDEWWQWSCKP